MTHILDLPTEIITLIFNFYLETETQFSFLRNVSKVCRLWKHYSTQTIFWRKFDGSLSLRTLLQLCQKNRLFKTEELVLSPPFSPKTFLKTLVNIFSCMPELKSVNFKYIKFLNEDILTVLVSHCPNLCELKLADEDHKYCYKISSKLMGNFLKLSGKNLTFLDLSYSTCGSNPMKLLLFEIAQNCPNLVQLHLHNLKCPIGIVFPIKDVQKACPKIKALHLGTPIIFPKYNKSVNLPGFPQLEIFTHPGTDECDDKSFFNILFNSTNLKVLDIRCSSISVDAILSLPATHLENIYLSAIRFVIHRMSDVFTKWQRSLRIVEFSRINSRSIDDVLLNAILNNKITKLEMLDLSYTNVSPATIVEIIENCNKLNALNLTSCRSIGRGKMRKHCGKYALENLYQQLTSIIDK